MAPGVCRSPRQRREGSRLNAPLESEVRRTLLRRGAVVDERSVRGAVLAGGWVADDATVASLTSELSADLRGFGPLEQFMADPSVTDITVNGADEVWVDRGQGMVLSPVRFRDDTSVRRMAQRLASLCGRRLDDACPYVDAPLPDGVRLHAVLPPLVDRVSVAIRVPRHRSWTLDDLTASGMLTAEARNLLFELISRRRSFLVTGGTGTGKTTLLNAMLGEVDARERIVIVEDTRELQPVHAHVVRLQTRAPNIERAGGVSMQDLVRQTLRMRPDRLVVGEVRGPEVLDLLTALNTGHQGGCGTVHANSATEVVPRLEALAALGGMRRDALHSLLAAGLDAVVHLERDTTGRRRLAAIALVTGEGDRVKVETAFAFDQQGCVNRGPAAARWHPSGGAS
ncbi:MAG TPA: TadA family conjugal transfer-associated ATPase [Actinomycetes bacterium]|nr:TadA family conjugal transfer-associated ATPase [Actinomycetes bacterium]